MKKYEKFETAVNKIIKNRCEKYGYDYEKILLKTYKNNFILIQIPNIYTYTSYVSFYGESKNDYDVLLDIIVYIEEALELKKSHISS